MSPFNWFLLLVVVAIFLFGFILIVARIARPHSKKMARGQAQLNRKRGATAPAAAAGTAGVSPVTPSTLGERASEWFMKYLWSILIVIALVGLVLWGLWGTLGTPSQSLQSPSLKTVWEWTKNYWHWILIASVIAWGFLSFVQKKKENEVFAKSLKSMLVLVLVTLFVVFPSIVTVKGSYEEYNTKACNSHFNSTEATSCLLTEEGVVLTSSEAYPDGKFELCHLKPEKAEFESSWLDSSSIKIRSKKGEFMLTSKLVERSKTLINGCPNSL